MFNKIKCSITYSRMVVAKDNVVDKVKNKVKDEMKYAKENPGKTAAKVATNIIVDTVIPAGRIINPATKFITKKVIDKDRVKSI